MIVPSPGAPKYNPDSAPAALAVVGCIMITLPIPILGSVNVVVALFAVSVTSPDMFSLPRRMLFIESASLALWSTPLDHVLGTGLVDISMAVTVHLQGMQ